MTISRAASPRAKRIALRAALLASLALAGMGVGAALARGLGLKKVAALSLPAARITAVRSSGRSWSPCPSDMAFESSMGTAGRPAIAFCIDRWEASLEHIDSSGRTRPFPHDRPVGDERVRAVSHPGVMPQAYVSMEDAQQACEAANKRLCTASEWVFACTEGEARDWPYGDDEEPGRCNAEERRSHPIAELYGSSADAFGDPRAMNDPRLVHLPQTLTPTGARAGCVTRQRVFDLVGNVHEWTAGGQFQGGYFMDVHQNGVGCAYRTSAHAPSYHDYGTGFRCCADVRVGERPRLSPR